MADYTYTFFDAVTLYYKGEMELYNVTFNDPVKGIGSLTGKCIITRENVETARACFDYDRTIMVVSANDFPLWGGLLKTRRWDPRSASLDLNYDAVKSYAYGLFLRPTGYDSGLLNDATYQWVDGEQTQIAADLLAFGVSGSGAKMTFQPPPVIVTGQYRDLTIQGMDFKYIGELIDTMANRTNGFEWTIRPEKTEGIPAYLYGRFFYPERKTDATNLFFEYDPRGGGNILDFGNPEESVVNRRTRVFATGAGVPPDQAVALDTDPLTINGTRLLSEKVSNYSTVVLTSTLQEHAQQERIALAEPYDQITLAVKPDMPDVLSYGPGDRCRVIVKDLWMDIDVSNARIVDRAISPWYRGAGEAVSITVDLSDNQLPDDGGV